jgi:hypothetical protein
MIGLLDPALLLPRGGADPDKVFSDEIDAIVKVCRARSIRLLPIEVYWDDLWSKLGRDLEKQLSPPAQRTLQELRKLGSQHTLVFKNLQAEVWRRGFRQLFSLGVFQEDWELPMASAVALAVSIDEPVIVFVRRLEGRNLTIHRVANSTLDENTRWALYVQLPGIGPRQVLCVYHNRNLTAKWTCRYDWRLPSEADGAQYPFVPSNYWWKGSTVAFRTVRSKFAWVDCDGNGWARPNIPNGAGYHWDVFIHSQNWLNKSGKNLINVVAFGVPVTQGRVGDIHH